MFEVFKICKLKISKKFLLNPCLKVLIDYKINPTKERFTTILAVILSSFHQTREKVFPKSAEITLSYV